MGESHDRQITGQTRRGYQEIRRRYRAILHRLRPPPCNSVPRRNHPRSRHHQVPPPELTTSKTLLASGQTSSLHMFSAIRHSMWLAQFRYYLLSGSNGAGMVGNAMIEASRTFFSLLLYYSAQF